MKEKKTMLTLKKADIGDAECITRIKIAAYNQEFRDFGPGTDGGPPDYTSVECTKEGIQTNLYYVIMLDTTMIGSFWLQEREHAHFELEDFVIHPRFQNKGYGRHCLQLMEAQHPEITKWSLGTPTFSVRNQHLYEKMGYTQVGKSDDGFLLLYEKII
jgi:ribosomal protein S18 acetylase RimI-like enzyme